jgi:hypothetical protein
MTATAMTVFLICLTLCLFPQELGQPQAEAQCRFSGGSTIRVKRIAERNTYELVTDEDLLTVKGMSVPAGHYTVIPTKERGNGNWTLKMRSETPKGESRELPPVPMSVIRSFALRQLGPSGFSGGNFTVSFDQTGGSCLMRLHSDKSNAVLSLEFTEKNTDVPVEP